MATAQTAEIKPKFWARLRMRYRIIVFVVCMVGLVLNFIEAQSFSASISYFTVQSNLMCFIMFGILLLRDYKNPARSNGRPYYILKGACTVAIVVTMIVYQAVLVPRLGRNDNISSMLLHTAVPLLTIIDFALFDRKGGQKPYYPFIWLMVPVAYLVYTFVYTAMGGNYGIEPSGVIRTVPYYFLDIGQIGLFGVIMWCLGLLAGFLLIGFVLYGIDHWLAEVRDN